VTGDTKVVGRGHGDGIFINTTGIGRVRPGVDLSSARVQVGDVILLSGTIGDHGLAVLSRREGIELEGAIASDSAPLHGLVERLLEACPEVHAMRDPTRGGVAATLCDIASRRRLAIEVRERDIPTNEAVRGACELLGLDPLHVANEGKLIAFVPAAAAPRALEGPALPPARTRSHRHRRGRRRSPGHGHARNPGRRAAHPRAALYRAPAPDLLAVPELSHA